MSDAQFNFGQIELIDARNFLKKSINSFSDLELKGSDDGQKEPGLLILWVLKRDAAIFILAVLKLGKVEDDHLAQAVRKNVQWW